MDSQPEVTNHFSDQQQQQQQQQTGNELSNNASTSEKHVHFTSEIEEKEIQKEKLEEKKINIRVIEFCPEDIQSTTFKRLFIRGYVFSDLIVDLNKFLAKNPDLSVKTIESFLFSPNSEFEKIDKSFGSAFKAFNEPKDESKKNRKLFGIRVWLTKQNNKNDDVQTPDVIHVYNYVPKKRITGFSHATFFTQNEHQRISSLNKLQSTLQELEFENFDEVVAEVNADLIKRNDFGNIVNIETVKMPLRINEYVIDVEDIEWPQEIRGFVFVLRVFVSKRQTKSNSINPQVQIEMQDFIPNMQTWDSPLAVPDFESFTSVLKRASNYLKDRNNNCQLLNCSTISCPAPELSSPKVEGYNATFVDSKRTYYSGKTIDYIIKFLRVFIKKPLEQTSTCDLESSKDNNENHLNCKIFVPQTSPGSCQTLQKTFNDWLENQDLILLSVETESVSSPHVWTTVTTLVDRSLTVEASPTSNQNRKMFFKLYVSGSIKEL